MKKPLQKDRSLCIRCISEARYIWYLNGIFEGYDGLAVVRTIDRDKGIIELLSTEDQKEELKELLSSLSEEIGLVVLDRL